METKDGTFQLEQFVPGAFLTQGLVGGAIAGFTFMFVTILWSNRPDALSYLLATPVVMIAGSIAGVFRRGSDVVGVWSEGCIAVLAVQRDGTGAGGSQLEIRPGSLRTLQEEGHGRIL